MVKKEDKVFKLKALFLLAILLTGCNQNSEDLQTFNLEIRQGLFIPDKIIVPENTKFKLSVTNHDDRAEEFDSPSLRREKIIPAKSKVSIVISPLKKGQYEFFAEFSPNKGRGILIVK